LLTSHRFKSFERFLTFAVVRRRAERPITPNVLVTASRNGKVIFPSWLGLVLGDAPQRQAAWYAFLGGAQVDIGPVPMSP
jgi:hypothetical protein